MFWIFPLLFTTTVLRAASGEEVTPTTSGLTRHKKQEMMQRYPESFDENGKFTGNKRTGRAY